MCFVDKSAIVLGFQMFVAGTDTTSASIAWLLLFTACYPEVKDNVLKEIYDVIGEVSDKCSDKNY